MISLVENVIKYISEFHTTDISTEAAANKMKDLLSQYQAAFPNDIEFNVIEASLNNILNKPNDFETGEQILSFYENCLNIFNAINMFSNSMIQQTSDEYKSIERKLFKLSFIPNDALKTTQVLPFYQLHDQFLTITAPIVNLKNYQKSGKTKCLPLLLVLRALQDKMTHPFIIITQPSNTIINDQIHQLSEVLGDSVIFVTNDSDLEKMYQSLPNKPVIALFTPRILTKVINRSNELNFDLIKNTRFVLNDLSDRNFDNDVLASLISEQITKCSFPLQLFLTSAELDSRVLSLFKHVESFEIPELYSNSIADVVKEVEHMNEFDKVALESFSEVIQGFANEVHPYRNVMIISPERKSARSIATMVCNEVEQKLGSLKTRIRLLKHMSSFLTSRALFYEHLEEFLLGDEHCNKTLYVLVIKNDKQSFNEETREICKNPIPNRPNIIKVVITTTESHVEVDNLTALIDCGICYTKKIDDKNGMIHLEEGPISLQTKIERSSLISKSSPGIYFLITLKGRSLVENYPTSIETDDITSNILGLRKIGLNFEDVKSLPAPGIPSNILENYINELCKLGALDDNKKITQVGSHFASFSSMSPMLSSSIVKASNNYKDNLLTARIVGVLVSLIMSTENLFVDPNNQAFQRNFNEDSDVITLIDTLLEAILVKKDIRQTLKSFGFHVKNALKVIEKLEQIASIIYDEYKPTLWDEIKQFCSSENMMDFINNILLGMAEIKPDWLTCRRSQYLNVIDVLNDCWIAYQGDQSISQKEGSLPIIKMSLRPGAKGLATPGKAFIFQLSDTNEGEYFGSIIHSDLSTDEIYHPIVIEASLSVNSVYLDPLIKGYLGSLRTRFMPFMENPDPKKCKGLITYPQRFGDKTIISYVLKDPNDEEATEILSEAVSKIEKIIPYVPRTILVKNDSIKAVAAITSFGSSNFTTRVFFYADMKPNVYQLDKTAIDYLVSHVDELGSIEGTLVVAMTGEKFTCLNEAGFNIEDMPTTRSISTSVFGLKDELCSHLVVISERMIANSKRLSWIDKSLESNYSNNDYSIHVANNVFKDVVVVKHESELIYVMQNSAKIRANQAYFGRIYQLFNHYSSNCIKDGSLVKKIDFDKFIISDSFSTGTLKEDVVAYNQIKRAHPDVDIFGIKEQIPSGISDLMKQRDEQLEELDSVCERISTARDKKELRKRKGQLKASIKKIEKNIHDLAEEIITQNNLTDDEFTRIYKIQSSPDLLEIDRLFVYPSYMEATVKLGDLQTSIDSLNNFRRNLIIDHVPLCKIVVKHLICSNLKSFDFEDKVYEVIDRFNGIVRSVQSYQRIDKDKLFCGCIEVTLYTCEFTLPFATEIMKAIGPSGGIPLTIPSQIIPSRLVNSPEVSAAIKSWIKGNNLSLVSYKNKLRGSFQELEKARKLLLKKETQPKIPFICYSIPKHLEINKIADAINKMNKSFGSESSCILDLSTRGVLFTPQKFDEKKIQKYITENFPVVENSDDYLYDHFLSCGVDGAAVSDVSLLLYNNNEATFSERRFCVSCCYEMFRAMIESFLDEDDASKLNMSALMTNVSPIRPIQMFPEKVDDVSVSIPLGQLLFKLIQQQPMAHLVRAWLSAVVFQCFHASPRLEFCPNHQQTLTRVPLNSSSSNLKCLHSGCQLFFCASCKMWHKDGECGNSSLNTPKPGQRCCPACKKVVAKVEPCNCMSCLCGKSFCFFCGFGPADSREEVFRHIEEKHEGAYFEDPPDYRKFFMNEEVDEEQLEEFYTRYPELRPPTKRTSGVNAVLSLLKKK